MDEHCARSPASHTRLYRPDFQSLRPEDCRPPDATLKQIGDFPLSGRIVPEASLPQIREVVDGPYRLIYRIKTDQIDIIAVLHGAQQAPWT